jgi:hypothetical protein
VLLIFSFCCKKRKLQILTGQNIYFQFFAGQKLYFRLLQDRLFISGYSNDSVIASNIQEIVESAKLKRSKEALTVMNTVTASVSGENLENSRCKMQLCKQLGIPTRRISGEKRIGTKILKSESLI